MLLKVAHSKMSLVISLFFLLLIKNICCYGPPSVNEGNNGCGGGGSGCGSPNIHTGNSGSPGVFTHQRPLGGSTGNFISHPSSNGGQATGGGTYWWQGPNSPFKDQVGCSPGSPGCASGSFANPPIPAASFPSVGQVECRPGSPGCATGSFASPPVSAASFPSVASPPAQIGNQAPPPGNFNFQLPSVIKPDNIQMLVQPQMGHCPVNFICVHWQLCKGGTVISDGSGVIDKRLNAIPSSLSAKYESCGGDMICCGIPEEGSTLLQGVITQELIPPQQAGESIQSNIVSRPHPEVSSFDVAPQPSHQTSSSTGFHSQGPFTSVNNIRPQKKPNGINAVGKFPGPSSSHSQLATHGQTHLPSPSVAFGSTGHSPSRPSGGSHSLLTPGVPLPGQSSAPNNLYSPPSASQAHSSISSPQFITAPAARPPHPSSSSNFIPSGNQGRPVPSFPNHVGSPSFGLSQNRPPFPQQPAVGNMAGMPMMMMPMGLPLLGGTCSAGTYCVSLNQCNPYNGFIIRDPSQIAAVWPDSPQVPLLDCFVPGGGIQNGVCCQESHPIIGPNGVAID